MDWQEATALAIVALTAAVMAWSVLRPRRPGKQSGSGCPGCGAGGGSPSRETLILHARKGKRPEVWIRPADRPRA